MQHIEQEKDVPLATPWLVAALVCILALFAMDAQAAGRSGAAVEGSWRLSCDTGVFQQHRADADTLLVPVDSVVWTLVRDARGPAPLR